jgi:hypothetical protein
MQELIAEEMVRRDLLLTSPVKSGASPSALNALVNSSC